MAATDATPFAVRGQAFRLHAVIIDIETQCPITGGLTALVAQISKDGAAFSATGVTATEIGTTGYVTVDINASGMTADAIIVRVDSSDANAVEWSAEIVPLNLAEVADRAEDHTVKRFEQFLRQVWMSLINKVVVDRDEGTYTVYDSAGAAYLEGPQSSNPNQLTKGKLDAP